jgi:small subunit ribosomal protein S8
MQTTDPVSDLLTRIRNGLVREKERVDVPASNLKEGIVEKLIEQGYIRDYKYINNNKQGIIRVLLKYGPGDEPVISELERLSKPGRRRYVSVDEIPTVKSGLGIALLSTSNGVLTDQEAREQNVGGELLCEIW